MNIRFVDPRYPSQKCSFCGHIERKNRPTQAAFRCKKCSFSALADHNAAINIREDFLKLRATVNSPVVLTEILG